MIPWKMKLFLAKYLEWWKYPGSFACVPSHWPKGQVLYPDGHKSIPMALGDATYYAKRFGGTVIPARKE